MLNKYISNKNGKDLFRYEIELNLQENNFIYLLGMPRIGKTHFLNDFKKRILEENENNIVLYLDASHYLIANNFNNFHEYLIEEANYEYGFELEDDNKCGYLNSLKSNDNQIVIMIDQIDGLSLNNLQGCKESKLKKFLKELEQFKYWARINNSSVIFCGRRHYINFKETLKKEVHAQKTLDSELLVKIDLYTSIVAASASYSIPYYLKGLNAIEVDEFCKLTIKKKYQNKEKLILKNLEDSIKNWELSQKVYEHVGGHPGMITQFLISFIVQLESLSEILKKQKLSKKQLERAFFSSRINSTITLNEICRSIYKHLNEEERDVLKRIIVSNEQRSAQNGTVILLLKKGILVEKEGTELDFFSPSFKELLSSLYKRKKVEKKIIERADEKYLIQIEVGGRIVTELTGKSAKLFYLIFQEKNQMASKDKLVTELYNDSEDFNPLYQLKNKLQNKIKNSFKIESKNMGYKLIQVNQDVEIRVKKL